MLKMFAYFLTKQFILIKLTIFVLSTPIKVLEKGILPLERKSVAIQFFIDLENVDKSNDCKIHCRSSKCCVFDKDEKDCDSVHLRGEYDDVIRPKDRKIFLFFYVTMSQLNQDGYCDFDLKYHCGSTIADKTQEIKVLFDTRLKKKRSHLLKNFKGQKIGHCKTCDEDPLNECGPVNCDLRYSGTKPFYNVTINKCIEAAECIADLRKQLPDIVYEPTSNACRDLDHSLTIADIYAINSGLGVIIQPNITKVAENLVVLKPNCSTISQNLQFLNDMLYGKLSPRNGYTIDYQESCNSAIGSIITCIVGISVICFLFVCFANTTLWFNKEWKSGGFSQKVESLKSRIHSKDVTRCEEKKSVLNRDVTNNLLREVIVSDLPLELRDSVVDICERIGKELRWKKRYRMIDVGSNINLKPVDSDTSTTSDLDNSEKERIMKY